jgi:hypothetical protein
MESDGCFTVKAYSNGNCQKDDISPEKKRNIEMLGYHYGA